MTAHERRAATPEIGEENTRDKILNAAGEVFAEQGFEGATVRAITQRAGVSDAAITEHFRDKAELYARVVLDACSAGRVADIFIAEGINTGAQRLRNIIYHWLQ